MGTLKTIFSSRGVLIFIYFVIGFIAGPPGNSPSAVALWNAKNFLGMLVWGFQVFIWPLGVISGHAPIAL